MSKEKHLLFSLMSSCLYSWYFYIISFQRYGLQIFFLPFCMLSHHSVIFFLFVDASGLMQSSWQILPFVVHAFDSHPKILCLVQCSTEFLLYFLLLVSLFWGFIFKVLIHLEWILYTIGMRSVETITIIEIFNT